MSRVQHITRLAEAGDTRVAMNADAKGWKEWATGMESAGTIDGAPAGGGGFEEQDAFLKQMKMGKAF